jgi:hypothetical protein
MVRWNLLAAFSGIKLFVTSQCIAWVQLHLELVHSRRQTDFSTPDITL